MEIWHNPRCSKSRQAMQLLVDAGVDPLVRRYLDDPPSKEQLADVLAKLGLEPWDLVRRGEAAFADLGMGDWPEDRARWLDAMAANPKLIERPIVIAGDGRAVVGRPPERVLDLTD